MSRTARFFRIVVAASVAVAAFLAFRAMILYHLPGVFSSPEEDMDFAWFVPAFSIWILWRERAAIRAAAGRPSLSGALAAIPFLALAFVGVRGIQVRFELLAFVGLAITVPWALYGRAMAARVAFPALCLLFCMPVAAILSLVTVHLRLLVSATSAGILDLFCDGIVRQGNMIGMAGVVNAGGEPFVIDIANPCSGLRSIFALMAISVGYGYFTQPTWARRAALFVCSVPIAVLANIVRIISICTVAKCCSSTFATGFYHDFSGFVVFGVAIFALLAAGGLIDRFWPARGPSDKAAPPKGGDDAPQPRGNAALAFVFATAVPALLAVALLPDPVVTEPGEFKFQEIAGLEAEDREPSEAEAKMLVGAEISKRTYKAPNGFWFDVSRVTSGPNKGSMHRPELCLPSQGFDMSEGGAMECGGVEWRTIRLEARGGMPGALFAYTFFNQDGYRTSSHMARICRDVWDRSVHGRIDRWTMLTVFVPSSDERILRAVLESLGGLVK